MHTPLALVFLVGSAVAQTTTDVIPDVSAELMLEKNVYSAGEPIILTFTARYTGSRPSIDLHSADAYGCASPYRIKVTPDDSRTDPATGPSCRSLFIWSGSCLFGSVRLRKGEPTAERILLNRFGDFSSSGNYVAHVARSVGLSALSEQNGTSGGEVLRTFAFSVTPAPSPDRLKEIFAPYTAGLQSESYERRREAVMVIGFLPTPFLEPDLVRLLEKNQFTQDAIRGLRRLNSVGSRAALFRFIASDSRGADTRLAIDSLAGMGDADYASQLVALMNKTPDGNVKTALLTAAARLDPKGTRPAIQRYLAAPPNNRKCYPSWFACSKTVPLAFGPRRRED